MATTLLTSYSFYVGSVSPFLETEQENENNMNMNIGFVFLHAKAIVQLSSSVV